MLSQISCCPNLNSYCKNIGCSSFATVSPNLRKNAETDEYTALYSNILLGEFPKISHFFLNDNRPSGVTKSLTNKMPFTAHSLKYKTSPEQETLTVHSNVIILSLQLGRLLSSQFIRTVQFNSIQFNSIKKKNFDHPTRPRGNFVVVMARS